MKKQFFTIALLVAGATMTTSCIDKLFHRNNQQAQVVDDDDEDWDDEDMDDEDMDDEDDADLTALRQRERDARENRQAEERQEDAMGDDEVSELLRKIAERTHQEVGSMGVVECIDEILSTRRLEEEDLVGMTSSELSILRNAIYARHGYRFNRDDLFNYFSNFSWYHPVTSDMNAAYNSMSATERYNIDFIRRHE